jgi:hypothetical protein
MKKLGKLHINAEKIMNNKDLLFLRGADGDCKVGAIVEIQSRSQWV